MSRYEYLNSWNICSYLSSSQSNYFRQNRILLKLFGTRLFSACIWHYNGKWPEICQDHFWASPGLHPIQRMTMQMTWTCWFTKEMNFFVWVQLVKCQSSKNFLFFPKCASIINLFKTHSLSEPQPWLGFWSRKLAPYSNASLRETLLLLIFELKRKIYCRRLQISLRCTEKFERFISWDSSSEMRQRLNIQIELVMRRHPYKTTVTKYLRKAGEKISFQRRKDQKMTQNFMD